MKQSLKSWTFILASLIVFVQVLTFIFLASRVYFADTEIWAMHAALYSIKEDYFSIMLVTKPIFFGLLKLIRPFSYQSIDLWLTGRGLFAVIGFGSLSLTYLIIKRLLPDKNKLVSIFALLVILSSGFFLSRGFRVRSDNLALFFYLASFLSFLRYSQDKKKIFFYLGLGFLFIMFLTTPKSIVLVGTLLILFSSIDKIKSFLSKKLEVYKVIGTLGLIVLFWRTVLPAYDSAVIYFINTFKGEKQFTVEYLSAASFQYLVRFALEDWHIILILFFAMALPLYKRVREQLFKDSFSLKVYIALLYLCFALILVPDKLPFYISSLVPILLILVFVLYKKYFDVFKIDNGFLTSLAFTLPFVFAFHTYSKAKTLYRENNNFSQIGVWKHVHAYLKKYVKKPLIYDGIGIFSYYPARVEYFPGQGLANDADWGTEKISKASPDLIIANGRTQFLGDNFRKFLFHNYIPLGHGVYGRSVQLKNVDYSYSMALKKLESAHLDSLHSVIFYENNRKPSLFISKKGNVPTPIKYSHPYGILELLQFQEQIKINDQKDIDLRVTRHDPTAHKFFGSTQTYFNFDRSY